MRRLAYLMLLLLLALSLDACAQTVKQATIAPITPGTRIGDFTFAKGGAETISYATMMICPLDPNTKARSCVLRVGTKANIGTGFYDDDLARGKSLDEMWSALTHEMVVEGRTVDLKAFGYVDTARQGLGTVRFPNIAVVAEKPGAITVKSTGTFDGEPFDQSFVLTFTPTGK